MEIYRGSETGHTAKPRTVSNPFDPLSRHRILSPRIGRSLLGATVFYRVKATGGDAASDSPWSNVV